MERLVCRRCGAEVEPEKNEKLKEEYPFYCPKCDENLYVFETEPDLVPAQKEG